MLNRNAVDGAMVGAELSAQALFSLAKIDQLLDALLSLAKLRELRLELRRRWKVR